MSHGFAHVVRKIQYWHGI